MAALCVQAPRRLYGWTAGSRQVSAHLPGISHLPAVSRLLQKADCITILFDQAHRDIETHFGFRKRGSREPYFARVTMAVK